MSASTRIYLPGVVRIHDAADVIGIAAGLKPRKIRLSGNSWVVRVDGVSVVGFPSLPQCAEIRLVGEMVDGSDKHFALWHWEGGRGSDRLLMPNQTIFWQAIGRTLINFFGGQLDLSDYDTSDADLVVPNQYQEGLPEDGEAWTIFQERKMSVIPISL